MFSPLRFVIATYERIGHMNRMASNFRVAFPFVSTRASHTK